MKKRKQILLNIALAILCIIVIFPFILVLAISLSNENDIINSGYKIIPMHLDFSSYIYVFRNPKAILDAYKVTFIFSTIAMASSVFLMAMIAYPLSRKTLKGRRTISLYLYFTMLFSGGLVPTYILFTEYLNLADSIWVYILPSLVSPWYVFIMRTFFADIPESIIESAYIDGASEYKIFFKFIIPLSKPVIATVALFVFLIKWNDWYTSMLYINKESLISLQYLLQRIMLNITMLQRSTEMGMGQMVNIADIPTETVRMAMAVVVAGPALLVFPFFQKYFVQGLTVGSVKG